MMTTPPAVLPELHALRRVLLILLGRVVTTLAFGASQRDQSAHETILLKAQVSPAVSRWAFLLETIEITR